MAFYSSPQSGLDPSFAFLPSARSDARAVANPKPPAVVLITEWFPPDVGGTPVLFEAIYSRLTNTDVIVLADDKLAAGRGAVQPGGPGLTVVRRSLSTTHWGLLDPKGLYNHLSMAREAGKLGSRGAAIVHCAARCRKASRRGSATTPVAPRISAGRMAKISPQRANHASSHG